MENGTTDRMPTFFVFGAAKCGTTSLHTYLDLHPEISMSSLKEPAFFLRGSAPPPHRLQVTDRAEYEALFTPGTRHRGESSVHYSMWPEFKGAPEAIHREVPDARFIYLVRDPVERVISDYVQKQANRWYRSSLWGLSIEEVLADRDFGRKRLTAPGMYMTQIRQLLEFFSSESILVLDSGRLRNDRVATLDEICAFLELEPMPRDPRLTVERNRAGEKAQERVLYVRLTESGTLRKVLGLMPAATRQRLVRATRRTVSQPIEKPALSEGTRATLEEIFRPEVEELREFTGQSFSDWSI
jgi:DNA-binding Xre family transcriptional regulator